MRPSKGFRARELWGVNEKDLRESSAKKRRGCLPGWVGRKSGGVEDERKGTLWDQKGLGGKSF